MGCSAILCNQNSGLFGQKYFLCNGMCSVLLISLFCCQISLDGDGTIVIKIGPANELFMLSRFDWFNRLDRWLTWFKGKKPAVWTVFTGSHIQSRYGTIHITILNRKDRSICVALACISEGKSYCCGRDCQMLQMTAFWIWMLHYLLIWMLQWL